MFLNVQYCIGVCFWVKSIVCYYIYFVIISLVKNDGWVVVGRNVWCVFIIDVLLQGIYCVSILYQVVEVNCGRVISCWGLDEIQLWVGVYFYYGGLFVFVVIVAGN